MQSAAASDGHGTLLLSKKSYPLQQTQVCHAWTSYQKYVRRRMEDYNVL